MHNLIMASIFIQLHDSKFNPNFFNPAMISSQTQPPQSSESVENIENSIQGLKKNWGRRQKWKRLFHCHEEDDQNEVTGRASWRISLAKFLESTQVHLLSLALLLLDLVFTVLDLSTWLVSCSRKKGRKKENVAFYWIGVSILIVLTAKMLALAIALGVPFFKRPGYVVDALVVTSALFLEVFVKGEGAGLLILVSLWRVVRVMESVYELSDEAIEAQIEGIVSQFETLRDENRWLRESLAEKDTKIAELENELDQLRQA